ncbi:stress-associated endoplasmic reticulum protein 2-like [Plasmopara halstedii]|uniref:Stress-associated endoplasmic reticulum protein 2-like n=1 Tax=Plasmopara halstedii TaxID=4781 RepID=A0A0N7L5X2_PLAHL|nr:stress-associated endoplasmic reticulum protein 2-like [Plasmopara halstedii]CEG42667.1 stress-associated endoplasmic reticulum protein 2-like [Plasmopara halstedii]|eukprot:XP_024579036.1 stress-associated endoplasmic reticulum protein 2-like [Plasmopara halstedii]
MANSLRMRLRSEKHLANITKRGQVSQPKKEDKGYSVGPILFGFFVFVLVGSALVQILQSAQFGL